MSRAVPASVRPVVVVGLTAVERLVELRVARRHAQLARSAGAVEYGAGHYPAMVTLHTGLLAGCLVEALWRPRRVGPPGLWIGVGVAAQALRWWCIHSLGPAWNTRVLVVPTAPLVKTGPYRWRWLRHPNYVAVVTEGVALPLACGAPITAATFSVLDACLLSVRIRVENAALRTIDGD